MSAVNSREHRDLAAAAAREGLVLLEAGVLPLNPSSFSKPGALLVTGPNALLVASGNYATITDVNVTAWEGVSSSLPAGVAVLAPGCSSTGGNDTTGFPAAVSAAGRAQAIVAFLGLDGTQEYEDSTRASLGLPGAQEALLAALAAVAGPRGTPIVLVLQGGSAVAPSPAALEIGTRGGILWAGYGGEEAGTAIADALFGRYNPAGRMPFTSYASVDHLPPYQNMSMTGAPFGRTFRYYTGPAPIWRFGEGGGYSPFAYGPVRAGVAGSAATLPSLPPCTPLTLSLNVTSLGGVSGDEVAQVYVRLNGLGSSLTPLLNLVDFKRFNVGPGESVQVSFTVPPRHLAIVDADLPGGGGWKQVPVLAGLFVGGGQPRGDEDWFGPQAILVNITAPPTGIPISTCPDYSISSSFSL